MLAILWSFPTTRRTKMKYADELYEEDDDLAHELLAVLRERSSMPHQHSDANRKHASEWLLGVARERLRHRNANS